VDSPTPLEEIETAVALIAEIDRRTPLVLQPESATYLGGAKGQDARRDLLRLLDEGQRIALESLEQDHACSVSVCCVETIFSSGSGSSPAV
jgi:hypothetical protein